MTEFYYEIPTLINRINTEIIYKAKNRGEGVIGVDAASPIDAEVLIREYLATVSNDIVYNKLLSSMSRDILEDEELEPFEFSETFTDENSVDHEDCIIYRVEYPEKMPTNLTPSIYRAIEDVLVSYCVWNWMMDINIDGWQKYEEQYQKKEDDLRGLTKRRVGLVRTYKLY